MKPYLITLDTGTTNTRASLWRTDGSFLGEEKEAAGVRDTARTGSRAFLSEAVGNCLHRLLKGQGVSAEEVEAVFAAGMITSNVGLCEVPHLTAPAAARDFAANVFRTELPDIFPAPFCFIRGMKNDSPDLLHMDIMRGEEVEAMALLSELPEGVPCVLILPGSHSKFVFADETKRLTACLTSLTGELLEVLTTQTILADSVGRGFASLKDYRKDGVLAGYQAARTMGTGRALFLTRIHRMFGGETSGDEAYARSFLLGAVLQSDAEALFSGCPEETLSRTVALIAGKEPFRTGLKDVLSVEGILKEIRCVPEQEENGPGLSARGIFAVAMEVLRGQN